MSYELAAKAYSTLLKYSLKKLPLTPEEVKTLKNDLAKSAELSLSYAVETGQQFPEGEKTIARASGLAGEYAVSVLKGPFPLGEPAISLNARDAQYYAREALKGRFEIGEPTIAKNWESALSYAVHVLKGRFELCEKNILKDERQALIYAIIFDIPDFITPKLEKQIAKSDICSYLYATEILKGPFPLGERAISDNSESFLTYYTRFLETNGTDPFEAVFRANMLAYLNDDASEFTRKESIEKIIATSAAASFEYSIIKMDARFELGEPEIQKYPFMWKVYAKKWQIKSKRHAK